MKKKDLMVQNSFNEKVTIKKDLMVQGSIV